MIYYIAAAWLVIEALYLSTRVGKKRPSPRFEFHEVVVGVFAYLLIIFLLVRAGGAA